MNTHAWTSRYSPFLALKTKPKMVVTCKFWFDGATAVDDLIRINGGLGCPVRIDKACQGMMVVNVAHIWGVKISKVGSNDISSPRFLAQQVERQPAVR